MASKKFSPEDYSRFLIREFLKKSKFDKTYDMFMQEDTRERVTMTKSQLTDLLGLKALTAQNSKTKALPTMLDVISNFLATTKEVTGGVELPNPSSTPSDRTVTTAASVSSYTKKQSPTKQQKSASHDPYANKARPPGAAVSNSTGQTSYNM